MNGLHSTSRYSTASAASKQTLTRIAMDEIEMKQVYNQCVTDIQEAPELSAKTRKTLNNMLQMIWECHERILEMQIEEDDDE